MMPYLMFYRVVQCGATEYEGTTLGTTKQTFRYIFMHQIKNNKMIKALFYKGLGVKERKRVRDCDNSTYPNGAVSCSKDSFVVKVPPFAKPQNVTSKPIRLHNNDQTDDN